MNLFQKLKSRLTKNNNHLPNFDESLGLFWFNRNNKTYYSNSFEQFDALYKNIFSDEIYNFISTSSSPLIFDCGSNIGLAVRYWKELFPDARIICFEPDPEVFHALSINTQNLKDVFIYQVALSNKIGEVEFTSNGKLSGSLNLSKNLPNSYKVKSDLLSSYLDDQKIEMLKIDIEGEELNVMNDIQPYLVNVQNLFVEYHSFINENQKLSELLKLIENAGFRYYLDSDLKNPMPLIKSNISLNQDLQVNVWAKRK